MPILEKGYDWCIQIFVLWVVNVEISSMLGRFWTSIIKPMLAAPSSDDANFTTSSANMF